MKSRLIPLGVVIDPESGQNGDWEFFQQRAAGAFFIFRVSDFYVDLPKVNMVKSQGKL